MIDDVNGGYLPEDLMLTARREEIEWVCCESVYESVPMQDCEDAGKILLKLSGWTQTSLWIPLTRQFDRDCVLVNSRRTSKARFKDDFRLRSCFCNATM